MATASWKDNPNADLATGLDGGSAPWPEEHRQPTGSETVPVHRGDAHQVEQKLDREEGAKV